MHRRIWPGVLVLAGCSVEPVDHRATGAHRGAPDAGVAMSGDGSADAGAGGSTNAPSPGTGATAGFPSVPAVPPNPVPVDAGGGPPECSETLLGVRLDFEPYGRLRVHGDYVYWSAIETYCTRGCVEVHRFSRAALTGGSVENITGARVDRFAVTDGHIYWISLDGEIEHIDAPGEVPEVVWTPADAAGHMYDDIAASGEDLYWTSFDAPSDTYVLRHAQANGDGSLGAVTVIATGGVRLVADKQGAYWAGADAVKTWSRGDIEPRALAPSRGEDPYERTIATNAATVFASANIYGPMLDAGYWPRPDGGGLHSQVANWLDAEIVTVDRATGTHRVVVEPGGYVYGVAATETHLFWVELVSEPSEVTTSEGECIALWSLPLAGGPRSLVARGRDTAFQFVTNGSALLYTSGDGFFRYEP